MNNSVSLGLQIDKLETLDQEAERMALRAKNQELPDVRRLIHAHLAIEKRLQQIVVLMGEGLSK